MIKRLTYLLGIAALALAVQGVTAKDAAKVELSKDVTCPVSGAAASADHALDHHGKSVYFCCDKCPKAFSKDMKKFAAKAHHQMLLTGQLVQVGCPMSGEAVDAEQTVEIGGAKVAFCCKDCKGAAAKMELADQIKAIFTSMTTKDKKDVFTLQTECPLSGKAIDASKFVEYEGKKVYFCCDGCPAGFEKEPAKYLSKLPQFAEDHDHEHEQDGHDHEHEHGDKEKAAK